jgi:hypothetical protein
MKATNKSQMDASINKKSTTKKASSSVPNPILGKSTGKLNDPAIGNRSTGSKLTTLIGKK